MEPLSSEERRRSGGSNVLFPGRQRTDEETADIFAAAAEKGLEANSTRAGAGGAVAAPGAAEEREEGESGRRPAAGATYSRCLAAAPFGSS